MIVTQVMFEADQLFVKTNGSLVSDMDGDKVMLSIKTGKYYNLGQIGGRIWELLDEPISINDIVDIMVTEYEVERNVCEHHVRSFLHDLHREQLIGTTANPVSENHP